MVFTRGIFLFVAITTAWAFARSYRRERTPFIDGWAGLTVVLTSTVGNMAYIGAVVQTDAANVVFIIALTPVIAATLSRLVLGERVHPFTWIATIVAFIGAGVIVRDGLQGGHAAGDMLAFLSAFCSASALTIIRASGKNVATSFGVGSLFSALLAVTLFGAAPLSLGAAGGLVSPPGCGWRAQRLDRDATRHTVPCAWPESASFRRREHVLHAGDCADAALDLAAVCRSTFARRHRRRLHHNLYVAGA